MERKWGKGRIRNNLLEEERARQAEKTCSETWMVGRGGWLWKSGRILLWLAHWVKLGKEAVVGSGKRDFRLVCALQTCPPRGHGLLVVGKPGGVPQSHFCFWKIVLAPTY